MSRLQYKTAQQQYADWGVDTDAAIAATLDIAISVHCWQGDDVVGFEQQSGASGGGIQATGNHPGRARTPDELRADLEFAYSMIPGRHRCNLHAMYLDTNQSPDRDAIDYTHFSSWVDWAKEQGIGLDFNPTFFAHEKADDNLTLAHPDKGIRDFWIEHAKRSRDIAEQFGTALGSWCVNNIWVPDGYKDTPINRMATRERLEQSLDEILKDAKPHMRDAVESKLFGIGIEACTVGSHEFYLSYAIKKTDCTVSRYGAFPSNGKCCRQAFRCCLIASRYSAACQPTNALGQRSCHCTKRRCAAHSPRACCI